jgi:hypothetical protein
MVSVKVLYSICYFFRSTFSHICFLFLDADILTAIIHAEDPYQDEEVQIYTPRRAITGNGQAQQQKKTLAAFFKDHISRVFCLNKDPTRIKGLINDMKDDFAARSGGQMEPNRVIFFQGGSEFYR